MKYKFNAKEYLKKKFIDGDYAIIPIHLENKEDFYNQHDKSCCTISTDICRYIESCIYNIPLKYKIRLSIECPEELTQDEKDAMIQAVKAHYGLIVYDKEIDLEENHKKALVLSVCGIIILFITYMVFQYLSNFVAELLLIAGEIGIWEAADIYLYDRKNLIVGWEDNKQIFDCELEFINSNEKVLSKSKEK